MDYPGKTTRSWLCRAGAAVAEARLAAHCFGYPGQRIRAHLDLRTPARLVSGLGTCMRALVRLAAEWTAQVSTCRTHRRSVQLIPIARTTHADYFPAGTGFGCGFLPLDSFFLSLLPIIFTPSIFQYARRLHLYGCGSLLLKILRRKASSAYAASHKFPQDKYALLHIMSVE